MNNGVVCDKYFCADKEGVSIDLTIKYLGEEKGRKIYLASEHMHFKEFTFSNGIFCSVFERKCFTNRYFKPNGERDGAVESEYTQHLFYYPEIK